MSEEIPASLAEDFRKLRESAQKIVERASSSWLPVVGIVWSVRFTDEEFRALEKLVSGKGE